MKLPKGNLKLEESQAAAAAGQIRLAHAYQEVLEARGIAVAQILLTLSDTEERRRYLNARNTIRTLLKMRAVPVINENDTVATTEIRYGDNDRLAARVAAMMSADCMALLSDVDGMYTADPGTSAEAQHLPEITEITPEVEAMAGEAASDVGSGGMATKVAAAKIALGAGCHVVIASGKIMNPLRSIENGARSTWFVPRRTPLAARKQWIAGSLKAQGTLVIDDGAETALRKGKSLLPAGVVRIDGRFGRGDAVRIVNARGTELARGLVAYSDTDGRRIMGHKSREIERVLGYRGRDEMVHRDDLVVVD